MSPTSGGKFTLSGRVVTMDAALTVIPRGNVYVSVGRIAAVQPAAAPPPQDFVGEPVINCKGTIYPGLIELHNHLSYNALAMWGVPKRYTNRGQWAGTKEYRRLISGPMKVVGRTPELLPALVRYVECKCLIGGVTTSQGIELYSNSGVRRYYRGVVRNVEQTDEPDLPEAATKIADVEARDINRFHARLQRETCLLLHLSEGVDPPAREHFLALRMGNGDWAITSALTGIHCAALTREDFGVLGERGGSMVWSPLSNLLLYGETARVREAKTSGVRIGLGSDWSPSGSKNLLGELKVARLVNEESGGVFSDADLVAMATREAAAILKWDNTLGTIESGKRADFLVVDGDTGDPYGALLEAKETNVRLVMVDGVARYGHGALVKRLSGRSGESLRVGGRLRAFNLKHEGADEVVGALSFAKSRTTLTNALKRLPELAKDLEEGRVRMPRRMTFGPTGAPEIWTLALDEIEETEVELRPRLSLPGRRGPTGPSTAPPAALAAEPLSQILSGLELDPPSVVDDDDFLDRLDAQMNLPEYVRAGLREAYE
jgi:5-methylthioadenosine/S-adenosylhomocysteine deaminase